MQRFLQTATPEVARRASAWHSLLAPLVYHCDLESQYEDMAASQKGNLLYHLEERKKRKATEEVATELSESSIFMRYLVEHMRQTLSPGAILKMSTESDLVGEAAHLLEASGPELELEGEEIYVQLVLLSPHKLKTIPGSDATRVSSQCMLMSPLQVCADLGEEDGCVSLVATKPPVLFLFDLSHPANIKQVWEQARVFVVQTHTLVLQGWAGDAMVRGMVCDFVTHGALPQSGKACLVPEAQVSTASFTALLDEGLVSAEREIEGVPWSCSFTSLAVERLVSAKRVSPSRRLSERVSTDEATMSTFELLSLVLERGWSWKQAEKRKLQWFSPGQEKIFCTRNHYLPPVYLRALLKVDTCEESDTKLFHCQAQAYYESFLAGTAGNDPPRKKRKAQRPPLLLGGDGENDADLTGAVAGPNTIDEPLDLSLLEEMMDNMDEQEGFAEVRFVGQVATCN